MLMVWNVALAHERKMDGPQLLMFFLSHEPCDRNTSVYTVYVCMPGSINNTVRTFLQAFCIFDVFLYCH